MIGVVLDPRSSEAPERQIALDMFRRGLVAGPVLVVVSTIFWGFNGFVSSAFALGLVLVNFLAGAWIIDWAVKISPEMLMSSVLGGFVLRMAILTTAVLLVRNMEWFEIAPFAITLIVTHLGLLIWETRYVSATLAHPGLKPSSGDAATPDKE
ncbi:MAG: ATP synthase subunit I [Acidimicrobiales bacterium]